MKKFKFRLERVLQYRELVKDEKKRALALRNAKLHQDSEKLNDLQTALLLNGLEDQAKLTAQQVQLIALYGARLKHEVERQSEVVEESRERATEALAVYVGAAQEAEALATLRRNKLEEYWQYLFKEDEKFLDELTIQRAKEKLEKQIGGQDGEEEADHES